MAEKSNKKSGKFPLTTVIGLSILLVGILIIVLIACMPMWISEGGLRERLDAVKDVELTSMTVYDPDLGNSLVSQGGTEKPLSGAAATTARDMFLSVAESVSFSETAGDISINDFDYRLRFNTDNGVQSFYLKDGRIYYIENSARHYFTPNDPDALAELLDCLEQLLKS